MSPTPKTLSLPRNLTKLNNQMYECLEFDLKVDNESLSYGFTVSGYCPCFIESITANSAAQTTGLKRSDLIMKINNVSCYRATLKSILNLIKASNGAMTITVYRKVTKTSNAELNNRKYSINTNKTEAKIENNKVDALKKKNKLLAKLFSKPSMWFSCAGSKSINILQCAFNSDANKTVNQTCYMDERAKASEHVSSIQQQTNTTSTILHRCDCCKQSMVKQTSQNPSTVLISGDTGYDSLTRFDTILPSNEKVDVAPSSSSEVSIETVTNTDYSYSNCDLTIEHQKQQSKNKNQNDAALNKFNETRTQLIGNLLEMEANFVSYLSLAVATFSRPLRGFFIKQQDYFTLFQNIEKILVISENFLRSMDKWSAMDLYTRIGQLYTQKMNLFREAFTIYAQGYSTSKSLLKELKSHSKQFRLFLREVQTSDLTLENLIDTPIVHLQAMLELFNEIRRCTFESKRSPSEAPHIESVIVDLRKILQNLNSDKLESKEQALFNDDLESEEDNLTTATLFMTNEESTQFKLNDNSLLSIIDFGSEDEYDSKSSSSSVSSKSFESNYF